MKFFVKDRYGRTININKNYAIEVSYEQYPNIWLEWKRYKTIPATLNAFNDLKKFYDGKNLKFRIIHKRYELDKWKEKKMKKRIRYIKNLQMLINYPTSSV